ncbi:hypothetical protein [Moorena producens]|uniref:hypothetical protein n=1 Tax=Moorena producens TaxID=1155739 RepID=UPI0011EA6C94|nr:hypothetical protein [Moorena producens]
MQSASGGNPRRSALHRYSLLPVPRSAVPCSLWYYTQTLTAPWSVVLTIKFNFVRLLTMMASL